MKLSFVSCFVTTVSISHFFSTSVVGAYEYLAEGEIETRVTKSVHDGANRNAKHITNRFRIEVADCKWLLTVTREEKGDPLRRLYVGYDGDSIYGLAPQPKVKLERLKKASKQKNSSFVAVSGNVVKGPVPLRSIASVAPIVWLAFGSGCFFSSEPSHLQPIYVMPHANLQLPKLPIQYSVGEATRLPERVEFADNGTNIITHVLRNNLVNGNFVLARYRVQEWASVNGLSIPLKFSIQGFSPDAKGVGRSEPWIEHRGVVTNRADSVSRVSFRPSPASTENGLPNEARFMVHEFRLGGEAANFTYISNRWLRLKEVKSLARSQNLAPQDGPLPSRYAIILAMVLVMGVGAGVLVKSKIRKRDNIA